MLVVVNFVLKYIQLYKTDVLLLSNKKKSNINIHSYICASGPKPFCASFFDI